MSSAAQLGVLAGSSEHVETFDCFGSQCTVIVADAPRRAAAAQDAVVTAKLHLLEWHQRFSRFLDDSELTALNEDPRDVVPVTPLMRRVLEAAIRAAEATGGLVDPTLVAEIEQAGYATHFEEGTGLPLRVALDLAPPRVPARASDAQAWRTIQVDRRTGTVMRPPGVKLDPGGIAKGVFADELGTLLADHDAFVVDCAGDIRLGGRADIVRAVHVANPFDDSVLHTFELSRGAVTTSGIGRRSWLPADGSPAHHLLDPGRGRPAFTGVVQATALAPAAAQAEGLSKAAVLSGPEQADRWLVHGGMVVLDDGRWRVIEPTAA
jgi:FAD:protein FMN transferase